MLRRNPLDQDEQVTLRKARLQATPGPQFSRPMTGAQSGIQAGATDGSGVFHRASLTNIDVTEEFYTAKG